MTDETHPFEKMFGTANPPPGKTYDFTYASVWGGRSGRGFGVSWSAKGIGFGEIYCEIGPEGQIHIDTEMMNRQFVQELLCYVAEHASLDEEPKNWKTGTEYWQEGRDAALGTENPYSYGNNVAHRNWELGYESMHATIGEPKP